MSELYTIITGDCISHSTGAWKKHKYIKKIGNRYIYATSGSEKVSKNVSEGDKENIKELSYGYFGKNEVGVDTWNGSHKLNKKNVDRTPKDISEGDRENIKEISDGYFGSAKDSIPTYTKLSSLKDSDVEVGKNYGKKISR